jgi:hypothetical protein
VIILRSRAIPGQINILTLLLAKEIAIKLNAELHEKGCSKGCHRIGKIEFQSGKAIAWTFRVLYHSHGIAANDEKPPVPLAGWEVVCTLHAWYWRKTLDLDIVSDDTVEIPVYYPNLCRSCFKGFLTKKHCAAGFSPNTIGCAGTYEKEIRCFDICFSENEGCDQANEGDGCHGCYQRWLERRGKKGLR